MLKRSTIASALVGALLMTTLMHKAQALPAAKPELSPSQGVVLVGRGGRGGFAFRGGGPRISGFSMRGGRGLSLRHGGGPRIGQFSRGGSRFFGNKGVSRYAYRNFRGFRGDAGKYRRFSHRRRGFRGYAYYGAPIYYSSCGWLYRKAIASGSPYWWDRYYACRGGGSYDYY